MANCPSCGGFLRFNIENQKLQCDFCSGTFDPYQFDKVNVAQDQEEEYGITVFTCPNCGGELLTSDHDLSGNCSYCGSPVVFDKKMRHEKLPRYIIPFQVTKQDCKKKYLEALASCTFAPKELKDPDYIEGFRGIYVPYWLYTVETDGEPFAEEGRHSYSSGSYDYTEIYKLQGKVEAMYSEISHDASSVLMDDIGEYVEPFEFRNKSGKCLKKFTPSYFSGFYAEPADVDAATYHVYAENIAKERSKEYLDTESRFAEFKLSGKLTDENFKSEVTSSELALLPLWFLSYRKNNRVAYAAVNGQTGQMVADVPIDLKIFFKYLLLAAVCCFAALSFFTILPKTVTMYSVVVAYLTSRFCMEDIRTLVNRTSDQKTTKTRMKRIGPYDTMLIFIAVLCVAMLGKFSMMLDDDFSILASNFVYVCIGLVFCVIQVTHVFRTFKALPNMLQEKYYGFLFPVLLLGASCLGTYILHLRPVRDEIYYFAALTVIAIALISFLGIILNYNRIATRPHPQFHIHTGGDDNAE